MATWSWWRPYGADLAVSIVLRNSEIISMVVWSDRTELFLRNGETVLVGHSVDDIKSALATLT